MAPPAATPDQKASVLDAAKADDLARIKALLRKNPNCIFGEDKPGGVTPLQLAAGAGHRDVVQFLLANGADAKAKDIAGDAPLHWAARTAISSGDHRDIAELLVASGADPNAKNRDSETPLHKAAFWGQKEVAQFLLASGAQVDARDTRGQTALHNAANEGHKTQIRRDIDVGRYRPRLLEGF